MPNRQFKNVLQEDIFCQSLKITEILAEYMSTLLKIGSYCSTTMGRYWDTYKIVSILLSKLSDWPTSLCYRLPTNNAYLHHELP